MHADGARSQAEGLSISGVLLAGISVKDWGSSLQLSRCRMHAFSDHYLTVQGGQDVCGVHVRNHSVVLDESTLAACIVAVSRAEEAGAAALTKCTAVECRGDAVQLQGSGSHVVANNCHGFELHVLPCP